MLKIDFPKTMEHKTTGAFSFPNAPRPHKTKLEINGVGVPVRNSFSFGYKSGVTPQTVSLSLTDIYADKVISAINAEQGKVKIHFEGNSIDNDPIKETFEGLSLLPRTPDTHTHDNITITDDRWRWPYKKVYGTFNLVRKVNDFHAFGTVVVGVRPTLIEARRYYVPWTLKPDEAGIPRTPWKALDIVVEILTKYLGYEKESIDLTNAATSNYIPANIVLLGQSAHSVLSRFLSDSDNNLYIEKDGKVVIYAERIPFGLKEYDQKLRPALRGKVSGNLWVQDRQAIRPSEMFVSFEKEQEFLLTYVEFSDKGTSTTESPATSDFMARKQIAERRIYLENVTETTIDDQIPNTPRGTLLTIERALEAFGKNYGNAPITIQQFRENYGVAAPSVFALVLQNPDEEALLDPKAVTLWNSIVRDYRRRFRIPNLVMQYIKDANNVLVEIINPETGRRKPSEVFSQVSWVVHANARITQKRSQGITLDSFDNLAGQRYQPVPILVSGIDTDFGTFSIQGLEDLNQPGAVSSIIMGKPSSGELFFEDSFGEGETILPEDSLIGAYGLQVDWEMSAIASFVMLPMGPESMHWQDVAPPDYMEPGNGPPVEIHVSYDTARYKLPIQYDKYSSSEQPAFVNEQLCYAIGVQEATKRWITYSDQIIGSVTFAYSKEAQSLRPTGPVSDVRFTIDRAGAIRVGFNATPISEGRDIKNTLDREVLEAIFKQVHFNVSKGTR